VKQVSLTARVRDACGKGAARALRRAGSVPAVLYGRKTEPTWISVSKINLSKVLSSGTKGGNLIDLRIEGNGQTQNRMVMLKELQSHPVKGDYLHVDFYEISMDEHIVLPVPIRLVGKAKGVNAGGILRQIKRDVEVKALPSAIPSHIEIDVSDLEIGNSIHLSHIELTEGVEILEDSALTVVTVLKPTVTTEEGEHVEEEEEDLSVEEDKE